MTTPTPKYLYKGTDISNLISSGTSSITNYTGFPTYTATNYSVENPLPFGMLSPAGNDVSTLMKAKFFTATTFAPLIPYNITGPIPNPQPNVGGAPYTPPSEFNMFRAVLIGGGGAGGNGGSCGWSGSKRYSGGAGRIGGYGGVTVIEGALGINQQFWYGAGAGGNQVSGGRVPPQLTVGDGANGGTGNYGGRSFLSFGDGSGRQYFVFANGGEGGGGGDAGNATTTSPGCSNPVNITNPSPPSIAVTNPPITLESPTVAYFTSNTTPPLGYANVYGNGGPGAGSPGLVQIYLLKK